MRRLVLLVALVACGDNIHPQETPPPSDAPMIDAPPDGPAVLAPCLDRPTDLPQPGNQLPCDLIPPSSSFLH